MLTSKQIRQDFLNFFQSKGHTIVPSAPVVPHGDPTLLFTNAGMNQFKDVFLGQGQRSYLRAADTQKCIRVSGKHNDLEEVGKDNYHHTFFEMLGNWSFGDYYKKEAIAWAWELLTGVWHLDKERLYATVFRTDDEAFELWGKVTDIDKTHILRFAEKDNFWEMGETGPCGPCSEIHYDRTPDKSGKNLVNAGVPEVMEIWNLVFIQNERLPDRSLIALPACHVDTGMGFERIVSLLQQKDSNYDTDIFTPLTNHIARLSGVPYTKEEQGIAHQVIADHIRLLGFSLADGVLPSNVGRGYVVRRILRRAARFGRKLNLQQPFLYNLVDTLVEIYGTIFPEIITQADHVKRVIKAEEVSFNRTLDRGIQLFEEAVGALGRGGIIGGDVIFRLYDTFGFPFDMTRQMAEERGLQVDEAAYTAEMAAAKERSRARMKFKAAAAGGGEEWIRLAEGDTTRFVGYEMTETTARILQYRYLEGEEETARRVQFLLDSTPFYGESGGQAGDTGRVFCDGFSIRVDNTLKLEGKIIHTGFMEAGDIEDCPVTAVVDSERRNAIRRNHTATHLLHKALRSLLGEHVQQKGSQVDPARLRFDFSHYEGVKPGELQQAEKLINSKIRENIPLQITYCSLEEANAMGAMALFGEKYEETVRMITIADYSRELCGGTHCDATGEIGLCKIVSEGSISAGIRRIEAVTGAGALDYLAGKEQLLHALSRTFKCAEADLPTQAETLVHRVKELQKENSLLQDRLQATQVDDFLKLAKSSGPSSILTAVVQAGDSEALKALADKIKARLESHVIVLGAETGGKAALIALVSPDLVAKGIKAGEIIKPVAALTGGGGGGAPHIAQAGGKDPARLPEAIAAAADIIREKLQAAG